MAQSVERPTSAQVMISRFVSSSPVSGPVLTARSLEPASDSVSSSLSAPPLLAFCFSLSHKEINVKNFFKKNKCARLFYTLHKNKQKMIKVVNVRAKLYNFKKKNLGIL